MDISILRAGLNDSFDPYTDPGGIRELMLPKPNGLDIYCLHLQLYRDSKDRYKQGQTKASLSLEHFLGLETGFTLDKESNTVAILCQDVVVVLAFDTRERLMQWQVKLSSHLNDGPHFLVLLSSAPAKARLPAGPARLHVQEGGFCLSTGVPPRVAGQWFISHLRRYGVVEGRFCFEGGSRCGKGEGLHVLLTDQGEDITQTLKLAAIGQLHTTRKRPVSRNMSVLDSPRRPPLRAEVRHPEITDPSLLQRVDSPYTDLDSNYGCGDVSSTDGWGGPPIERCLSCISKLGAMSRSSTATTAQCWEHTCDRHSISSGSDSSGWSQAVTRPPARPPKSNVNSPLKSVIPTPSYENYDIPKIPYPVKTDHQPLAPQEHYDTPRKIKECLGDTVRKPCGCILRVRPPESERPCMCQRLLSCWSAQEDVQALYATVDMSKKCSRLHNYANLQPQTTTAANANLSTNYENMDFAQSLQLYENAKQVIQKAGLCSKCGHKDDYLMMEPPQPQPTPGYIPMSPAVKQRLGKVLSSSNPNLAKPSGSAMLQTQIYQRKQILDCTDNLDSRRKRSNSADSTCSCNQAVRRSSSVPCKANRDSSSSNDSGVFELPRRVTVQTLPRRSKSSDPLGDLSFQFQKADGKSASAEAEVPVCPSVRVTLRRHLGSGTSDMSDYIETLSLSSHSSSDAPPPSCTLRPRSGNEYLTLQRLIAPVPEERHN
ncbi:PTB domain (IRS-1 type) [Popillia japonica]|uniref:PTB domain (IRS-1 type) n=1 Tax=Popillia japonica TaxID=7064 RepID=A0AAW1IDE9_POPJA